MVKEKEMNEDEGKPPVFKTWRGWYALILGALLFQLGLFLWLTLHFK